MPVRATANIKAAYGAAGSAMPAITMPGRAFLTPHFRLFFLLVLALFLSACGKQELYRNVEAVQANDMVSTLQMAGISASKTDGEKGSYNVMVDSSDFARAQSVLKANGLPREEYASLCTIFQKGTYNSSPGEEHARFICALQQELTNTISQIDGVVESRVHLNIPEKETLGEEQKPSSASVFVKYRPGFDLSSKTGQIKTLVQNSVSDLAADNISVMMMQSKAVPPPKTPFYQGGLVTMVVSLIAFLAVAALALGIFRWWRSRPPKANLPVVREKGAQG